MTKSMIRVVLMAMASATAIVVPNGKTAETPAKAPADLPPVQPPAASDIVPTAKVIQLFYSSRQGYGGPDCAGKSDMPKDMGDFRPCNMVVIGDYLYSGSSGKNNAIHYFKRDEKTGMLSYSGKLGAEDKERNVYVCAAGGRLYAIRACNNDNQIAWYDIEAQSGKPVEKGAVVVAKNDVGGHPDLSKKFNWMGGSAVSKDQKNLYVMAESGGWKMLWYRLGADGAPVLAKELAGKGIEASVQIAPDGSHLYCMSREAIACIEISPTGEPAAKSAAALDPKWNVNVKDAAISMTLSFTPDGNWLYAHCWVGVGWPAAAFSEGYLGIYKRDPATGALALHEAGSGNDSTRPDFKLANSKALNLVFMPDGLSGFAGTGSSTILRSFRCDPNTGRLKDVTDFPEWDLRLLMVGSGLWLDGKNGFLYGVGSAANIHGAPNNPLWVARVGKGPAQPTVKAALTGNTVSKGVAAEANWPHWRGPTYDSHSPLKGIRKDWTGGLKKVWEVEGLSPGRFTWSTVAVQGDRVVVSGRHGALDEVFCLDADKGGQPLWTAEFEGGEHGHFMWGAGPHATPTISGDKVYCANLEGTLVCINLADGKILWKRYLESGPCSPLVYGNLVIMPTSGDYWHGKYLTAMNKETGEVVWTYGGGACNTNSSPVLATINGKEQIVAIQKTCLFGIEPASGKEIWKYTFPAKDSQYDGSPLVSPVIWNNIVWPNLQFENDSPTKLWSTFKGGKEYYGGGMSEPIILDGYIYQLTAPDLQGFHTKGWFVCADAKTGEVKWVEKTGAGSMVCVDGCLLCLTYEGDLMLVEPNPQSFKKLGEMKGVFTRDPWQHERALRLNDSESKHHEGEKAPCWASPTVAHGKIYLHYSDRMVCYDLMQ